MAGDVEFVSNVRIMHCSTELAELVDDSVDGVLVARDRIGGKDDGVAFADRDEAVLAIGDAPER